MGLRNMTLGLIDLKNTLKSKMNMITRECLEVAIRKIEKYLAIFETPEIFSEKLNQFAQKYHYMPLTNISNIVEAWKEDTFNSLNPNSYAYKMIGQDLSKILDKLTE